MVLPRDIDRGCGVVPTARTIDKEPVATMDDAFSSTMGDLPEGGMLNLRTSTRTSASSGLHGEDVHRVQIAFVQHGFGDAPLGVFVRAMPAGLMTMSLGV
jgi:hypothetical protein